jgi:hypothetical protein
LADQKIELEIVLDDGSVKRAFANVKREANETGGVFSNAFKIGGVTDFVAAIYATNKAFSLLKETAQSLVNVALAGEKLDAITKRFQVLAQQQNINADALAQGISRAIGGTVDLDDALKITSQSLINLQTGIAQIPQLFEIAKKSAAGFGGDTVSNFERIQQAIVSGNTGLLREIGIFFDAGKAVSDYEKQLGAVPGGLTEAGRQQAILNEVLKVGNDRFKNITNSIVPLDQAIKQFGVSFGEVADTFAQASNRAFGESFRSFFTKAATTLDAFNVKIGEFLLGKVPSASENIKVLTYEIGELQKSLTMAQVRGDIDRVEQINSEIAALRERILVEQQLTNQQATKAANDLNEKTVNEEKLVQTRQLTYELLQLRDAQAQYEAQQKKAMEATALQAQQLGQVVKSALVNSIAQSVLAMTKAIMKGENALAAVGKTILGVFGDLAIQTGTILIGIGIGIESLKALSGFAAIAAGIGLVAIGGVLKALSGGEGANTGVNASGGGVAFSGDTQTLIEQNRPEEIRETQTAQINLTVQGDILDSDDTGLRLVKLLNDSIDTKGAIVRGMA